MIWSGADQDWQVFGRAVRVQQGNSSVWCSADRNGFLDQWKGTGLGKCMDLDILKLVQHDFRRNWLPWGSLMKKMWHRILRRGWPEGWSWWRTWWRGSRPASKQRRRESNFSPPRERKCQRSKRGNRICHDVNVRTQRSSWTGWRPVETASTSWTRT